jgi:hypothetical protein
MVDVEVAVPAREQDRLWLNRFSGALAPKEGRKKKVRLRSILGSRWCSSG